MKYILSVIFITAIFLGLSLSTAAALDPNAAVCGTAAGTGAANTDLCKTDPTSNPILGPNGVITEIIGILSIVIGVAAVLMIVIAGFEYTTSGGESQRINTAKNTIIFAIVGLAIAVSAQLIIFFVLNNL